MKIRLLSDLHLDINRNYPFEIGDYTYTLIAGDLGGDYKANAEWIKRNIKKGAFISGNHDAYTRDNAPLDDVKEYYHKEFPIGGDVEYFDDDVGVISKDLDDKTILIADVLYTDYRLKDDWMKKNKMKIKDIVEHNKRMASPRMSGSYMNDFNFFTRKGTYKKNEWGFYDKIPSDVYYLRPENYKNHFDKVFKKIIRIVEDNKDKNIILMTHHCLSEKCIAEKFSKNSLNASYVSPKDNWIKKHPNIKLILSGHVHHRSIFNVGSTKYVLNPLGYCKYSEYMERDAETREYRYWTPDLFVDTETWDITTEHNEGIISSWKAQNDKDFEKMIACSAFIM